MTIRLGPITILICASAGFHAASRATEFTDGFEPMLSTEPADLAGITAQHNSVRSAVVTEPALLPLAWSASLAATAQAWANQCVDVVAPTGFIDHNPGRSNGHPYYVGENTFASSGSLYSPAEVVNYWAREVQYFNYAANTCTSDCGHYTQLVWRTTAFVGCARSDCPALTYRYSVVCNYGPGGNTGGRPY